MKKNIYVTVLFTLLFISAKDLYAGPAQPGDIVFFPVYTGNPVGDIILKAVADKMAEACSAAGRLVPAEYNSVQSVFRSTDGRDKYDFYRNTATGLNVQAYSVITIYTEGRGFRVIVEFFTIADCLKGKDFKISVYASVADNIPLKAAREFYHKLEKFPLYAKVTSLNSDGSFTISAGQWHGLVPGSYNTDSGKIKVLRVSRFTSEATGEAPGKGAVITIYTYPENKKFVNSLEEQILENTNRRFGTDEFLNKRKGGARELFTATCLVNQGASFCAPGYGSFLSLDYLGVDNASPDKVVICTTVLLTAGHLVIPSVMTDFDVNFFPWVKDSDKTGNIQRLQYFLWATVPVTFTVSYYSQLASQYRQKSLLPPVFENYNITAGLLSTFIPGGGLFYKGYSVTGWFFYAGEMSLAGCAVYNYGSNSGKYCLAGFAALKAIDIIAALVLDPAYQHFRSETAEEIPEVDFSAGFVPAYDGSGEFVMNVSKHF